LSTVNKLYVASRDRIIIEQLIVDNVEKAVMPQFEIRHLLGGTDEN
jgi:hypothetical protein